MTAAATLLRWYRQHGRVLPWRETQDPYRILVSEIMLQQTQVDRVKEYYRTWLTIGPSISPHFDKHLDQEWLKAIVDRLVRDGLLARR